MCDLFPCSAAYEARSIAERCAASFEARSSASFVYEAASLRDFRIWQSARMALVDQMRRRAKRIDAAERAAGIEANAAAYRALQIVLYGVDWSKGYDVEKDVREEIFGEVEDALRLCVNRLKWAGYGGDRLCGALKAILEGIREEGNGRTGGA